MKAIVLREPFKLEIVDIPRPEPCVGEALLKIRAVGVCGSDLHAYRGRHPLVTYPRILGHEIGAEILEIGENDRGLRAGDSVAVEPLVRCGRCYPCRIGRYNCCVNLKVLGIHSDFGMAEYAVAPVNLLHKAPPKLAFESIALCETLTIGAQAVARGGVCDEDTVAIIGSGPIGLMAMQYAKSLGARVIMLDLVNSRLDLARQLGADHIINPKECDAGEQMEELTGGEGPAVVIEAVGSPRTIRQAVEMVSFAGRVVVVGISAEEVSLDPTYMIRKELDFRTSRNSCNMFPRALKLIKEGKVQTSPMVTHRFPLVEFERALKLMEEHPDRVIKTVLEV
ncbi:MAG: zinc-binding alcohol dehydrogenase family protein [bacterium]